MPCPLLLRLAPLHHDGSVLSSNIEIPFQIYGHVRACMTGGPMATLLQLKSLLAVVDRGGFTAASQELGMSQPAVSRSIATLEKELGLPLLARQRDGVLPTEAGARALIHAREAVRQLDLMRTEVAAMAGHVTGILRVASLP